jgi:HlyD family secretion protein
MNLNQDDQATQPAAGIGGAFTRWWKPAGAVVFLAAIVAVVLLELLGPVRVTAIQPQRGPLVAEVFGTGTLEAKVTVSFSAKMIDKVVEVLADQGDTVTDGQVLARLEATDYEHSVRVAEAGVGQAQAELVKARLDIARERDLRQTGVVSKAEFDTYESTYRVADAKLKNAEAQLGFARARLADTVIRSPLSGLVMTRNLEVGDTVVPGTPIFRIADTRQLWVTAMVDERVAGNLRVGQPARVTFRSHPGESFPGRLARLAQEADRITEEQEADVALEQLPPGWFVGAKADVYIETAREADALQVPKDAVAPRGEQPGVFVTNGGHARWQPVQLGLIGRDAVELVGGVDDRDLVITDPFAGKQPLADGQRVTAVATTGGAQ